MPDTRLPSCRHRIRHRPLGAALIACLLASALGLDAQTGTQARVLQRHARLVNEVQQARADEARIAAAGPAVAASFRRPPFELLAGDLVSASSRKFNALRVRVDDAGAKVKTRKVGETFVPRGVDFDPDLGLLAIAAVSRVVIYAAADGAVTVLDTPDAGASRFGFVNDVLFDGAGGLLIADQGALPTGSTETDGAIWRYDPITGEFVALGSKRRLTNPKLLARDRDGTIFFIDGEAGPLISPVFDARWDSVSKLTGKTLQGVTAVWNEPGVQASAYDIDRQGRHWFVNLVEIVTLRNGVMKQPCPLPFPFRFVTGIAVDDGLTGTLLDGTDSRKGPRQLLETDMNCNVTALSAAKRLKSSRGIALVGEPSS